MSRAPSPAEGRTPPPEMDPPTLPFDDARDPPPPLVDEDPVADLGLRHREGNDN